MSFFKHFPLWTIFYYKETALILLKMIWLLRIAFTCISGTHRAARAHSRVSQQFQFNSCTISKFYLKQRTHIWLKTSCLTLQTHNKVWWQQIDVCIWMFYSSMKCSLKPRKVFFQKMSQIRCKNTTKFFNILF